MADAFIPSATALLAQIDVALLYIPTDTNIFQLTLNADSGGLPGTTILDSWTLTNLASSISGFPLETVTPHSSITLSVGTQYWLVASTPDFNTSGSWHDNSTGAIGLTATTSGGPFIANPNTTLGAFDVIGASVPEPGTFVFAAAGLALCLARRRR